MYKVETVTKYETKEGMIYWCKSREDGGENIRDALYIAGVENDEGFKRVGKLEFEKVELSPRYIRTAEGAMFKSRTTTITIIEQ